MGERLHRAYGLKGEPEALLEAELENLYKTKQDAPMDKATTLENAKTAPAGTIKLRKISGVWGFYVRIEDDWYKVALTKV